MTHKSIRKDRKKMPSLRNMYDVLFDTAADAKNSWEASTALLKLNNHNGNNSLCHFINDTFHAYQNNVAFCLARLFDKQKNSIALEVYLKALKKEYPENKELDLTLSKIRSDEIVSGRKILEALKIIRNYKYAHHGRYNVANWGVEDDNGKLYEVSGDELRQLIEFSILTIKQFPPHENYSRKIENFFAYHMQDIISIFKPHLTAMEADVQLEKA
jgi:hypothetical protein